MTAIEHQAIVCEVCRQVGRHAEDVSPRKMRRMLFGPTIEAWCDFATGKPVGRLLVMRYN